MAKQIYYDKVSREIKNRIKLSVYAYAYEIENHSIIDDSEYDRLSLEINPDIDTGNEKLDKFFREEFDSSTGMWILKHPELDKVKEVYWKYYRERF